MNEVIKQHIKQIKQGQVPKGYKKTKVGVVPIEWEDTKLGTIGTFSRGKGLPGTEMNDIGVPCIGYGDIYTKYNFKFDKAQNFVDQKIADESVPIEKGTVMFTCSGETALEIGKCICYIGDELIYVGGDIAIFETNKDVDPLFVAYQQNIFFSIKQKARYGQGHSVVHIYGDTLAKLSVAYPKDIDEQQKIAEILSTWDKAIYLQEKLLEKLELQKKALMQKLLTPKDGWEKMKLGDMTTMSSGGTPLTSRSEYYDGDVVWVSINDMTKSHKFLFNSERKLTRKGVDNSSVKIFPENTILYAMYASIGECCISKVQCGTSQAILGIQPIDKLVVEYLYYCLASMKEKIKLQGQTGTQSNLNKGMVKKFEIYIPPTIEVQKNLAYFFSKMDASIFLQSKKLIKLKEQQKAMQQLLLTGIVRV